MIPVERTTFNKIARLGKIVKYFERGRHGAEKTMLSRVAKVSKIYLPKRDVSRIVITRISHSCQNNRFTRKCYYVRATYLPLPIDDRAVRVTCRRLTIVIYYYYIRCAPDHTGKLHGRPPVSLMTDDDNRLHLTITHCTHALYFPPHPHTHLNYYACTHTSVHTYYVGTRIIY